MASSGNPFIGYGTDFQRSTDGGATYNGIGQILELQPPKMKVKDIQMTNLLSPSGFHEFRSGLRDPGEGMFKLLFKKQDYNTIFQDYAGVGGGQAQSITRFWKAVFPDLGVTASMLVFQAYVRDLDTETPLDDLLVANCTFKITGPVTFTQGT
jgi:hypothetical protein